jgi:hypothetical protein
VLATCSLLLAQNGPAVSVYLTLFGIVAGFVSTFWSFGYTRLARRLRGYLQGELRRVRKSDVVYTLQTGCWINILGMASTLLGLQARPCQTLLCLGAQMLPATSPMVTVVSKRSDRRL